MAPAPASPAPSPSSRARPSRHNVTINNILPGPFETDRLPQLDRKRMAEQQGMPYDKASQSRKAACPPAASATPEEFGAAAAFMCSQHAGFITGQNLLLDGGGFPGSM